MAYFDNAATTFPKPNIVYEFMCDFYKNSGANAGRGHYGMAQSAGALIKDTRERIQKLLHCPAKQVVFTPTATIALNIIIQGLIKKGLRNIYISPFEHNAVTRTLHYFEEKGDIVVSKLHVNRDLGYDLERIRFQFDDIKPDLVIISHVSNVIGLVAPIEEIFAIAKEYKAYTVADMSQSAGLFDTNVGLNCFDFAVFAGHKTIYGPTGISGFVMNPTIVLEPVLFGGTGFESANQNMPMSLPERYEMGTGNIAGIAGLNAALKWLDKQGIGNIWALEMQHRKRLLEIINRYDFLKIVGNNDGQKFVGIVSCIMEGISSDSAGAIFDRFGISVRTGLHCAPLAHQFLGTYPAGTIRFSIGYFTSDEDFEALEEALDGIEDSL
ncbi:MAG: aminotransferase class V-fold PLP-dependent enzyme [Erysipelotrichaceae bacterium]|nr:aminotransferase class V-fold PLP-dependent enzyme [Erysipelotrichaceae bacterium]